MTSGANTSGASAAGARDEPLRFRFCDPPPDRGWPRPPPPPLLPPLRLAPLRPLRRLRRRHLPPLPPLPPLRLRFRLRFRLRLRLEPPPPLAPPPLAPPPPPPPPPPPLPLPPASLPVLRLGGGCEFGAAQAWTAQPTVRVIDGGIRRTMAPGSSTPWLRSCPEALPGALVHVDIALSQVLHRPALGMHLGRLQRLWPGLPGALDDVGQGHAQGPSRAPPRRPAAPASAWPPAAERYPSRSDATTAQRAAMPSRRTMPNDSPRSDGAHRTSAPASAGRHFLVAQQAQPLDPVGLGVAPALHFAGRTVPRHPQHGRAFHLGEGVEEDAESLAGLVATQKQDGRPAISASRLGAWRTARCRRR